MTEENSLEPEAKTFRQRSLWPLAFTSMVVLAILGTATLRFVDAQQATDEKNAAASFFETTIQNDTSGTSNQGTTAAEYRVYVPKTVVQTIVDPTDPTKTRQVKSTVYEMETRTGDPGVFSVARANPLSTNILRLDNAARKLINTLRSQSEQDRDEALLAQLRDRLTIEFEQRHAAQVTRLEKITAEVQRTEEILQQRGKQRDEIVERRMTELLGGRDRLDWDYEPQLPQLGARGQANAASEQLPGLPLEPGTGYSKSYNELMQQAQTDAARVKSERDDSRESSTLPALDSTAQSGALPPNASSLPGPGIASVSSDMRGPQSISAVPSDDIVNIGYRWRGLIQRNLREKGLGERGVISKSQMELTKNSLDAIALQWQFKIRDMEAQLEAAKLNIEIAQEKFVIAEQQMQSGLGSRAELLEARQALITGELEVNRLKERLDWAHNFEKDLNDLPPKAESTLPNEPDAAVAPGSIDPEIVPEIETEATKARGE